MDNLLILHGALGSKDQFTDLSDVLRKDFKVFSLDFSGHASNHFDGQFSIDLFVSDVISFLEQHSISKTNIFGYSMGGYVALKLATIHPSRIERIITLATKFNWTNEIAAREASMLMDEEIEIKFPKFTETLRERHSAENWKGVLSQTAQMMIELGNRKSIQDQDLQKISNKTLILIGSDDKFVTIEESNNAANQLQNAEVMILQGIKHPIETVDVNLLAGTIRDFLVTSNMDHSS